MFEEFKALVPFWFNHLYVEAGQTIKAIPDQVKYLRHVFEEVVDEVVEAKEEIKEAIKDVKTRAPKKDSEPTAPEA